MIKRGKIWWDEVQVFGERKQFSTGQTNINKARLVSAEMKAKFRAEARGVDIEMSAKQSPMFKAFMNGRFLEYIRRQHAGVTGTIEFYESRTKVLVEYQPFARAHLADIDADMIEIYRNHRQDQPKKMGEGCYANSTINRELTVLRHALGLASKWNLIGKIPLGKHLPEKNAREYYVLTGEMENFYLSKLQYPLKEFAILMLDLGLRPIECVRLDKRTDIRKDEVIVRKSKTAKGRRALPLTPRAAEAIQSLSALWPDSPWLFPSPKKAGTHYTRTCFDHLHEDKQRELQLPDEFVLYSLRHTFGTRLAESGASPFEIKEAMGHTSIKVSEKYIHLSAAHLTMALKRKQMYDEMLRGSGDPTKVPTVEKEVV